jgi:hypothetical protein
MPHAPHSPVESRTLPEPSAGRQFTLRRRRAAAKLGMTVSLGVLVITGMNGSRASRRWHVAAGAALIGFSAWHHQLYPSSKRQ